MKKEKIEICNVVTRRESRSMSQGRSASIGLSARSDLQSPSGDQMLSPSARAAPGRKTDTDAERLAV